SSTSRKTMRAVGSITASYLLWSLTVASDTQTGAIARRSHSRLRDSGRQLKIQPVAGRATRRASIRSLRGWRRLINLVASLTVSPLRKSFRAIAADDQGVDAY